MRRRGTQVGSPIEEWSPHGREWNAKPKKAPVLHNRNVTKSEKYAVIGSVFVVIAMLLFWRYENRVIEAPLPKSYKEEVKHMNTFGSCEWRRPKVVMFMRIPKAASTAVVNGIRNLAAHTRRYRVHTLPDFRMGTGHIGGEEDDEKIGCWGENRPSCSNKYYTHFETATKLSLAKLAHLKQRHVVEGHVFLTHQHMTSVIATARDPIQRLASGYEYVQYRKKKRSAALKTTTQSYPDTIGACAANATCAAERDLGRLCSLHTLYFCGFNDDICQLDPLTRIATDAALDQAILNLNLTTNNVLLVIPVEELEERGYTTLEALLPTYFHGLADAVYSLPEDRKSYDSAGRRISPSSHPHKSPDDTRLWETGLDDPLQAAAINRLCKQDLRLYEFIKHRFNQQAITCRTRSL